MSSRPESSKSVVSFGSRSTSAFFPSRKFDKGALPPSAAINSASVYKKIHPDAEEGPENSEQESSNDEMPIVFCWDYRKDGLDGRSDSKRGTSRRGTYIDIAVPDSDSDSGHVATTIRSAGKRRATLTQKKIEAHITMTSPREEAALFREEFSKATRFYYNRQFKRAVTCLTKALQLRKDDRYCLVARAKCHLRLGKSSDALADAEASLKTEKRFPRGLFMKAEALFHVGKFEMALVFYHRGLQLRPEMRQFRVGIQKAEEAINNSIGPGKCERLRTVEGVNLLEPGDVKQQKKGHSARQRQQSATSRTSSALTAQYVETQRTANTNRASKLLLGQLYEDKLFLQSLLSEEENRKVKHVKERKSEVRQLCLEALTYLEGRTEFWRQQEPVSLRAKARQSSADITVRSKQERYFKQLSEISATFHRGDYGTALNLARDAENRVINEPDIIFPNKPEIFAFLNHVIGNCWLEKGDYTAALGYFNKEHTFGEGSNMPDVKIRALDDIGRAYARMGEHEKAIDVWTERMNSQPCSLVTQAWLYHEIGRGLYELNDFSAALDVALRALELANACRNKTWVLHCSLLTGQIYLQLHKLNKALDHFYHALDFSESNEHMQKTIKGAIELVTRRIRSSKQTRSQSETAVVTTYHIELVLSALEYSEESSAGHPFIMLAGAQDKATGPLAMNTFYSANAPTSVELSGDTSHRRISNLLHGDVYIDGLENFVVDSLTVDDVGLGEESKRWHFDAPNGGWITFKNDPNKRAWRMPAWQDNE